MGYCISAEKHYLCSRINQFTQDMIEITEQQLLNAVSQRHSVRAYQQKSIAPEAMDVLKAKIEEINRQSGLHVQLVTDEPRAFQGRLAKYGKFSGVTNYLAMIGKRCADLDERIGYYGEQLVLTAQALGLNTCWVGLTYSKIPGAFELAEDEKMACCIAIGYGQTQGVSHKIKTVEKVSNADSATPLWFRKGVEAALLAPTAVNQQRFHFEYVAPADGGKPTVKANRGFSLTGYTRMDLGIVKLHFELAAGRDNFVWG